MKNSICINLKKDRIVIKILENVEQSEIIECLKTKMSDLKKLYKDEKTPIYVARKSTKE